MDGVTRFELDPSVRRLDDGRVLVGGSPVTMFRLSDAGRRLVARISAGEDLAPGHEPLTDRLLAAGAIHPLPMAAGDPARPTAADVTLVIPVYGADPARVRQIVAATGAARVIVVDDASPTPFPALTDVEGGSAVEVVRLERNGGPGVARQAGWERATTAFVAFVDADVTVRPGWLDAALAHARPGVGLVAPRVRAAEGRDVLSRFEALRSPLDLGPQRARIRATTRVAYVPAAALVVRTEALRAVGGFADLRLGEDVDLVWRLDEAGWGCRYEPDVEVRHDVRASLGPWLTQRVGYGASAAELERRHPGCVVPVQVSGWSAAAWALPVLGAPLAGVAVAAASTAALAPKLPELGGPLERAREAGRLAGLGHLHAGRMLASALTRVWWPIALALALVSKRARRTLLAAALVPSLIEWWKVRHELDPVRFTALHLADDAAYGLGVWRGLAAAGDARALRPRFTGRRGGAGRQR